MDRKEFLSKTFQLGIGSCLGMFMLSSSKVLAGINGNKPAMINADGDDFLKLFGGIKGDLNRDLTVYFPASTIEFTILTELKKGWGERETVGLLQELSSRYGDKAIETMTKFVKLTVEPYWTGRGKTDAKVGTEVEDFIHALWGGMGNDFQFTSETTNGITKFCVTKCPYAELAQKTNMREWVYVMACITDYYMTPSFSKEIGFSRNKTMVQGDISCNHTYYNRNKIKPKDALLGYCGLYCGACPSRQNTKAMTTVDYKRSNYYEVCEGCNSGFNASWCAECKIKECARSKNHRVCLDCNEYPCDKMTSFINDAKYPYHKEVKGKMKQYKKLGLDKWLVEQEKTYLCKKCGTEFNFTQKTCGNCGSKL